MQHCRCKRGQLQKRGCPRGVHDPLLVLPQEVGVCSFFAHQKTLEALLFLLLCSIWDSPYPEPYILDPSFDVCLLCTAVQFSRSVMSDSLQTHGLQHSRLPCPSPTPEACSNSCPSSRGCHPITSSSVVPFSSCLQSFPVSGSFPRSQFFTSGGQSIGESASTLVLPMNNQCRFASGLTGLISLQSKGLPRVFSNTIVQKYPFFSTQLLYGSTLIAIHDYWKNHSFD